MALPEFLTEDRFYLDLENDRVQWVYYNPDSNAGGQFVMNVFDRTVLEDAMADAIDAEDAFDYIGSVSHQQLVDRGTEQFSIAWTQLERNKPFAVDCSFTTLEMLQLAFQAQDLINQYCHEEFGADADFTDLRRIGIGYTTITDDEHDIQAYVNLLEHRIEIHLNWRLAQYHQYDSLADMVKHGLPDLTFDDLTYLPEWLIENHVKTANIEDLAMRMTFFVKEHKPDAYAAVLEPGETDADMVSKMRSDLRDMDMIPDMIDTVESIIKDSDLSGAEKAKCYDLMTDLYHIFADELYVPVYDRESAILYTALEELGMDGYEVSFDGEGVCLSKGDMQWHNDGIYSYLANALSVEDLQALRAANFESYIDLKDLAAHYDVRLGTKLRVPFVARIDFLSPRGTVGDSVEYRSEEEFLKALKEELHYGVPLSVVLYRDSEGKTISRSFLEELDTLPKGLTVEDAPLMPDKKPSERSEAR